MLWYQVICARGACTIDPSGQASANALMYLRFRSENPCISGKEERRSKESLSIYPCPQPCLLCRSSMSRPICP
jgi:hypothetical protein